MIERLKKVAPKAEKEGIILGVESYLDAAGHLDIIEGVGSKNIKAYIDFRNTADAGYNVLKEVKLLGHDNICDLHMKEMAFCRGREPCHGSKYVTWFTRWVTTVMAGCRLNQLYQKMLMW